MPSSPTEPIATGPPDRGGGLLDRVLGPAPGPFAILRRPAHRGRQELEVLAGPVHRIEDLAGLGALCARAAAEATTEPAAGAPSQAPAGDGARSGDRAPRPGDGPAGDGAAPGPGWAADERHDVLALLPYRQITERGFACHDGGEPVLALRVREREDHPLADALARLEAPGAPAAGRAALGTAEVAFDVDDAAYAHSVRRVIDEEIGSGSGANFVIRRTLGARLPGPPHRTALAMFARLLRRETGAYWTFVVHTGEQTFVGATPERHVVLAKGTAVMNPISGTYRHPPGGADLDGLLTFLADRKETDELTMVVDEELKMMAQVCADGGRVKGPYLKTMARLTHTEYLLEGASDRDPVDILRATMFAPTVTGSPLENACRVITRHERGSRGYYSGVAALIGRDRQDRPSLDSAILIRTAELDPEGALRLSVGATLVRHSDPASEAAETRAKAASLLDAAGLRLRGGEPGGAGEDPAGEVDGPVAADIPSGNASLGDHPRVKEALDRRNDALADFWLHGRTPQRCAGGGPLAGLRTLVVDAEDSFTAMLAVLLRSLGARTDVRPHDRARAALTGADHDLVVVGPGPGDPRDPADPRIAHLRRIVDDLLAGRTAFLAVCLGHQVLARRLGLDVRPRSTPGQGAQAEIGFFGRRRTVGFYNTFAAFTGTDHLTCAGVPGRIEVARDPRTGEVHGLRGPGFASAQFHPESVLTRDGRSAVADLAADALTVRPARRPAAPARRSA
ncbi:anthranilate synthase family protein [Streptomyces sp. NPDC003077]|uniref:anthranilate synthase family protein n=1 Tax=Streptomyces sp. NPDC003077 TaxID=3154443 RepID=UPI0033B70EC8